MGTTPPVRPSAGRSGLALVAGALFGAVLLAPGWPAPLDVLPSGQFGTIVAFGAFGLLAFTLVLWLVVVAFVLS